jgi:L-ascorbate oxidase
MQQRRGRRGGINQHSRGGRAWRAVGTAVRFALLTPLIFLAITCGDDEAAVTPPVCFTLSDGRCVAESFQNPPVLQPDEDGVYDLWIGPTEVMLDGQRHCVRAYNDAYTAPTIDTAARVGDDQRQIRINLANRFQIHDYGSLEGETCECKTSSGQDCLPEHVHDACLAKVDEDCTCTNADGEECVHMFDFNVTNLHAHGSHVRPDYARGGEDCESVTRNGIKYACRECGADVCDGDNSDDRCYHGDNVLNALHIGTGTQYRWDIDEDSTHHTGLQWYHPHIHGTTAIQVASGAAGAWIVRGPLDALDGIANARERVMLFSTPSIADEGFVPLADGEECTDETITFNSFEILGSTSSPQLNMINGVRRPRMITPPGQVERWRIIHAGFLDEVFLGLFRGNDADCTSFSTADADTIKLTQIGRDGLIMPQTFEHEHVFMSPGYRVEAMLGGDGRLEDGDTWCMVAARFLQDSEDKKIGEVGGQPMAPSTAPTPGEILARFDSDGDVVAILNVTSNAGTATTTTLPDYAAVTALAPDMDLGGVPIEQRCADAATVTDAVDIEQAAVLQVGVFTTDDPDPCDCAAYNVNCNNFETTDRSLYPADRDMPLGAIEHWRVQASVDGHPFHIHINPYIVCPNDNVFDPIPFPHFRDTYLVNLDRKIDAITENRSYTGPFVFHCHKLTHEDHGMMELIRICDPQDDPTCGDYGWRECQPDDVQCLKALAATDCALNNQTDVETFACITALGVGGVCGPNGCASDQDCGPDVCGDDSVCAPANCAVDGDCPLTHRCDVDTCVPAPCNPPCMAPATCQHGGCQ